MLEVYHNIKVVVATLADIMKHTISDQFFFPMILRTFWLVIWQIIVSTNYLCSLSAKATSKVLNVSAFSRGRSYISKRLLMPIFICTNRAKEEAWCAGVQILKLVALLSNHRYIVSELSS